MIYILKVNYSKTDVEFDDAFIENNSISNGIGINIHGNLSEQDAENMKKAGITWVRIDLRWDSIEEEKGLYDFKEYDILNNILKKNQLKPYFILNYSNELYEKGRSIITDEGREAFAAYVKEAAKRYKGNGVIWEIWNEPNLDKYWINQPSYNDYSLLVQKIAPIIKSYDESGLVVAPALAYISDESLEWLEKLLMNKNVIESIDAISVHPYRGSGPETVLEGYEMVRKLVNDYSEARDIPIICGEWGYSVGETMNNNIVISEQKQAELIIRMLVINISKNIPLSMVYLWKNDGEDQKVIAK